MHVDLDKQVQSNERLAKDLKTEQEQSNAYRVQLDTLTQEIHELETSLEELKQEKNQFLLSKMEDDKDTDGQDVVRRLTKEKVRGARLACCRLCTRVTFRNNPNSKPKT